jgi:GNAT superfamily N-acetyltransferase
MGLIAQSLKNSSPMRWPTRRTPQPIWTKSVGRTEIRHIQSLLWFLPSVYPGGDSWLANRLADVIAGKAYCSIGGVGGRLGGVLIETPKGRRHSKISTFYVHPCLRRLGIGSHLLRLHNGRWRSDGIDTVHITVSAECLNPLGAQLAHAGFRGIDQVPGRYREQSIESVFQLSVH